jgi:hypothetical protein
MSAEETQHRRDSINPSAVSHWQVMVVRRLGLMVRAPETIKSSERAILGLHDLTGTQSVSWRYSRRYDRQRKSGR